MAKNEDSKAFTVLKQNAEDFKKAFDEDIAQCLSTLDTKITELLCDQESSTLNYGEAKMLNAHMVFSRAKLDIFVSMKNLINEYESSWIEQLNDLKEVFVENVEIFLAGTKLEVKEDSLSRSGGKKSSLKGRKSFSNSPLSSTLSSLYPSLASLKNIGKSNNSNMISLVPEDVQEYRHQDADSTSLNIKPIRKLTTSPEGKDTPGQNTPRKKIRFRDEIEDVETIDVEDEVEEIVVQAPVQKKGRGRKPAAATPASLKKAPAIKSVQNDVIEITENDAALAGTPVRPSRGSRKSVLNTPTSLRKVQTVNPLSKSNTVEESSDSSSDQPAQPETRTRRSAKNLPAEAVVNVTPGRQKRTAKKGAKAAAPEQEVESSGNDNNTEHSPVGSRTPKNVHFSLGLDVNEDLDIYSPEINLARSVPRRKTTMNATLDPLPDSFLTPDVGRSKTKRKTIAADFSDLTVAPSPKRLKKSASRSSIAPSSIAEVDTTLNSGLLDSDEASGSDNYTQWIPLADAGAKAPSQPGVYELKVPQAKKPAYIGGCENLKQKLTLHKVKHNTGHKHLDKFVERNNANILVRYEKMAALAEAKSEERKRVANFVALYKTTPAFN